MPNYALKSDLRNATSSDTLKNVKWENSAYLRSEVDKLDIDKIKNVSSILIG